MDDLDIFEMTEEEFLNEAFFLMDEDEFMRLHGKEWNELQERIEKANKVKQKESEESAEKEIVDFPEEDIPF